MLEENLLASLPLICAGGKHCCSRDRWAELRATLLLEFIIIKWRLCGEGGGDCEVDEDCAGSLVCGHDNCLQPLGHLGELWDATDDCCVRKCGPDRQCRNGEVNSQLSTLPANDDD